MPVRNLDDDVHDALRGEALGWLGSHVRWVDAHTHIGRHDPDGERAEPEELLDALHRVGGHHALVFPMHEPGGDYRAANDEVLGVVARHDELRALVRVDPADPGAREEVRRGLDGGAAGLKLHPRSDGFGLDHPAIDGLVAEVAARGGVVLFHAGRGIPNLGRGAVALAEAHPGAALILAHAGISDLDLLAEPAARLENLFFDTSWWHPGDLLQLFCTVPPGRILYASDMPYGPPQYATTAFVRCAREAGLGADAVREMAGGQLERILSGQRPADLGPAPGTGGLGARVLSFERALSYLVAAITLAFRGGPRPDEALAMAALATQIPNGDVPHAVPLRVVRAYVEVARQRLADGADARAAIGPMLAACLVAGTPQSPAPLPAA